MPDTPLYELLLTAVKAAATLAFARSGLLEAACKRLDAVSMCAVSGFTAFGEGTLRDVLLDRRPFFWAEHAAWLLALLALYIGAMFVLRARHFEPTERTMQWPDALGLGLISASGTQLELAQDLPAIVAVLIGVVTAAFGGVLRDIVVNEIPRAFKDRQPLRCVPLLAAEWWLPRKRWACTTAGAGSPAPRWAAGCARWRCSTACGCRKGLRPAMSIPDPLFRAGRGAGRRALAQTTAASVTKMSSARLNIPRQRTKRSVQSTFNA